MTITLEDITLTGSTYSLVGPWAEIVDVESPFNGLFSQTSSDWNEVKPWLFPTRRKIG